MTRTPPSCSRLIRSCLGAIAKDATRTPSRTSRSTRSTTSAWSARMLTPKGASVRSRTSLTARRSSSSDIVAAARMPSPPAADVAAASCGVATYPIPVCTIGYLMPSRSVSRVRITRGTSGIRDFLITGAGRVEPLQQQQLLLARHPGDRHVVGDNELEPGRSDDVVDAHSRMQRTEPHPVFGGLEVEDGQVGDDVAQRVKPRRSGP